MNDKQKKAKCSEILNKYGMNSIVTDEDEEKFLFSIFECSTDWEEKRGVGIKNISIAKHKIYPTRCFQLNRFDGSFDDISYGHCITPRSKKVVINDACRSAISNLVQKFRDENVEYGVSVCCITGEVLTRDNTEIDHYDLEFDEMFKLWLAKYDEDFLFSKINKTLNNADATCFTDDSIIEDFVSFHNENSKLRAVTAKANKSRPRRRKSNG
ncbi:Protein of unknown function (DUF3223) [Spirosomataceae bacterium]|jgi:hypothetical protein